MNRSPRLVDDEVTVHDGGLPRSAFREVEVEFVESASRRTSSRSIATRLWRRRCRRPNTSPRSCALWAHEPSTPPTSCAPPSLDFASTATEVLRAAIIRSTARLLAHDPGVRLGSDPRTCTRPAWPPAACAPTSARSARWSTPAWDESLRDELKWLAGSARCGARHRRAPRPARAGHIEQLADTSDGPGDAAARRPARPNATRRATNCSAAMRSTAYFDLLERLLAASRVGDAVGRGPHDFELDLGDLVKQAVEEVARRRWTSWADDPPDAELHAVRIRAKRVRYAAEAVAPAVGKGAKRFASAVAGVQEVLGDHQDAVVAGRVAARPRADRRGRGGAAFVAGQLAAWEAAGGAGVTRANGPRRGRTPGARSLRRWM